MTQIFAVALLAAVGASSLGAAAQADDFRPKAAGTFLVDLRVTDVSPDASDPITTAAGVATGLHVGVTDSVMPTLGFTYFLTDHVAVEAILGATEHEVSAIGAGSSTKARSTWVLPPVVALQYHFQPKARFSPYLGVGVNSMVYFGGHNDNGFIVKLDDSVGAALQAGADVAVRGPWSLNVDVKKVFVESDASIDEAVLKSKVNLNPWVLSLGFGHKF